MIHRFADFEFDDRALALSRSGARVRTPRKVLEVLAALVRRQGEVVTREDLFAEVWPGAHVETAVLTQAIFLLRKALGDSSSAPRFVGTIQGRGYVFLGAAEVTAATDPASRDVAEPAPAAPGPRAALRWRAARWAAVAAIGAVAPLAMWSWWGRADVAKPSSAWALPPPAELSPPALEGYLEARHVLAQRDERGLNLAVAYFERSIALAPGHAPSHAGLAEAEALLAAYDYGAVPARNRYERARRAARRAVELDPRSGEGWAVLGLVSLIADLAPDESLWHLDRAVDVAPGSARAHHWRAWVLFLQGRPHAAEAALARARALDPLSPIVRTAQATLSHYSGRLGEARARCQEVLELQPDFARARLRLGLIAEQEGDFGTAERQLQMAARELGDSDEALAALAHLYGRAGRHAERQRVLAQLGKRKLSPLSQAVIWLGAGDEGRAVAALAEGVDQRRLLAIELVGDSRLEGIRHRLFEELPTLAGLPNRGQQVAAGHLVPWNP